MKNCPLLFHWGLARLVLLILVYDDVGYKDTIMPTSRSQVNYPSSQIFQQHA